LLTTMHLNLRVDPTQYISQIREVPSYDYIHMVRQPKYMIDLSLLNEKVHYLNEIFSPKEFVEKNKISLLRKDKPPTSNEYSRQRCNLS
jgi:colanic acid/amylovoran biosynthesis glycosyltransferase